MKYYKIFVLNIVIVLLSGVQANSFIGQNADIGLLSFMARANDILQQDPARSLNCFNYYIPKINEIAQRYEANFKACLNASEIARNETDEATYSQRKDLATAAEQSCNLLGKCFYDESVQGVFQCYIDGSASNIQTMYSINANASQELAALREKYYLIESQEYRCTNETKRAYEKESTEAYAQLNSCILGQSEVPTDTTPLTTTTQWIPDSTTRKAEITTPEEEPTTPAEELTTPEEDPITESPIEEDPITESPIFTTGPY